MIKFKVNPNVSLHLTLEPTMGNWVRRSQSRVIASNIDVGILEVGHPNAHGQDCTAT